MPSRRVQLVPPRRFLAALALLVWLGPLLAAARPQAAEGKPALTPSQATLKLLQPRVVPLRHPGTLQAARERPTLYTKAGPFVQAPNGLLIPDRRIVTASEKDLIQQARWSMTGRYVDRSLALSGARLAPLSYQRMVGKLARMAEGPLAKLGMSTQGWKIRVLDGGRAEGVNATCYQGGVIVINRDLIDTARHIATAVATAQSPADVDRNVHDLTRWNPGGGAAAPKFLRTTLTPKETRIRDKLAESVVAGVLYHELGHALLGHLAMPEPNKIIVPSHGLYTGTRSRRQERAADAFAVKIGATGGAAIASAMPLIDYFFHMRRPSWKLSPGATHPLASDRYNAQLNQLARMGRPIAGVLPAPLRQGVLVGPDGRPLSSQHPPTPPANPAP